MPQAGHVVSTREIGDLEVADPVDRRGVVLADFERVVEEPVPLADDAGQLGEPGQASGREQERDADGRPVAPRRSGSAAPTGR